MVLFEYIPDNPFIEIAVFIFLGLLLGSFSTAIIYRTRIGQSWIWNKTRDNNKARSFCPSCGHTLRAIDLIPVISWCVQKGRCRYCTKPIGKEYLLTELAMVLLSVAIYLFFGFTLKAFVLLFLLPFLVSQGILLVKYNVLSKLLLGLIFIGGIVGFYL